MRHRAKSIALVGGGCVLLLWALVISCSDSAIPGLYYPIVDAGHDVFVKITDLDHDGYSSDDCDDTNPNIHPNAVEIPLGVCRFTGTVAGCLLDEDCGAGRRCSYGACLNECQIDEDCEEKQCINGLCMSPCVSNEDCTGSEVCNTQQVDEDCDGQVNEHELMTQLWTGTIERIVGEETQTMEVSFVVVLRPEVTIDGQVRHQVYAIDEIWWAMSIVEEFSDYQLSLWGQATMWNVSNNTILIGLYPPEPSEADCDCNATSECDPDCPCDIHCPYQSADITLTFVEGDVANVHLEAKDYREGIVLGEATIYVADFQAFPVPED